MNDSLKFETRQHLKDVQIQIPSDILDNVQLSPINGSGTLDNEQLFPSPILKSEAFIGTLIDKAENENEKINAKFYPLKMAYCKGESSHSINQYLKPLSNSPIVDYYTGGGRNMQKGFNMSPNKQFRKSFDGFTNQYNQVIIQEPNINKNSNSNNHANDTNGINKPLEGNESPLYHQPSFDFQNQHFNMSPSRLFDHASNGVGTGTGNGNVNGNKSMTLGDPKANALPFMGKNLQDKIRFSNSNSNNAFNFSFIKKSGSNSSLKQTGNMDNSSGKNEEEQELYMISFDSDNAKENSKLFDDQDDDFNILITQDNTKLPLINGKTNGTISNTNNHTNKINELVNTNEKNGLNSSKPSPIQQFLPSNGLPPFSSTNSNFDFNSYYLNQINQPQTDFIDHPSRMGKMQPQMSLKQGLIEKLQIQKANDNQKTYNNQLNYQSRYQPQPIQQYQPQSIPQYIPQPITQYQTPQYMPQSNPYQPQVPIQYPNQYQPMMPFNSNYQPQNQIPFHQHQHQPLQYHPMQMQYQQPSFQQNSISQVKYQQDNSSQYQPQSALYKYNSSMPFQQQIPKPMPMPMPMQIQNSTTQQLNNITQPPKHIIPTKKNTNPEVTNQFDYEEEKEIVIKSLKEKQNQITTSTTTPLPIASSASTKKKKKKKNKKKKKITNVLPENDLKETNQLSKDNPTQDNEGKVILLTTNNYYSNFVNNIYVNNKQEEATSHTKTNDFNNSNANINHNPIPSSKQSSSQVTESKPSNSIEEKTLAPTTNPTAKKKKKKIKKLDPSVYINSPIEDLAKNIFALAKDQGGCRYLQTKIDEKPKAAIPEFFITILPHIIDLSNDAFGNYLIQKILTHLTPKEIKQVMTLIEPKIFDIGSNSHGTRVIQSLINYLTTEDLIQHFITMIKPITIDLIKELNGTHVIQKFSDSFPKYSHFIYQDILNNAQSIATHRHGCCVLQRYLINKEDEFCIKLVSVLMTDCLLLSIDQFGNYIIQAIMKLHIVTVNNTIAEKMLDNIIHYSKHKYSSNIVEKCFDYCDVTIKHKLLQLLSNKETINDLLVNEHGNYVVQKVLASSDVDTQSNLLMHVAPLLSQLKSAVFGEKIISRLLIAYPQLNTLVEPSLILQQQLQNNSDSNNNNGNDNEIEDNCSNNNNNDGLEIVIIVDKQEQLVKTQQALDSNLNTNDNYNRNAKCISSQKKIKFK